MKLIEEDPIYCSFKKWSPHTTFSSLFRGKKHAKQTYMHYYWGKLLNALKHGLYLENRIQFLLCYQIT